MRSLRFLLVLLFIASPVMGATAVSDTSAQFRTGEVYCDGNPMLGTHIVEFKNHQLRVNGQIVDPWPNWNMQFNGDEPAFGPNDWFQAQQYRMNCRLQARGASVNELVDSTMAIYRQSGRYDTRMIPDYDGQCFRYRRQGDSRWATCLVSWDQPKAGGKDRALRQRMEAIMTALTKKGIVVVSELNAQCYTGPEAVAVRLEIARAQRATPQELSTWRGRLNPSQAKAFHSKAVGR